MRSWGALAGLALSLAAAGCAEPGRSPRDSDIAPLENGHRLMAAGEFESARDAYLLAATRDGLTADVLAGIGSADLHLGRLGQAERWLRLAVRKDPDFVPAWNNLGVVLMEKGEYGEASEAFRRAFALDSGSSDTIRDNLRLALARMEDPAYTGINETEEVQLIGWGLESRPLVEEPL
ncbi:tetratricopeptide repeat protein [Rubellimicrobium thermophilum]|uniref:tetratricopeptide repeat protein n=1 Tax=Rubellimicrobium thermophilum TaxID=295419 RepID=UPI0004146A06|nr:tetratricopeptide repeat protein [Rubellimicrobium thermophilum]